MLSIIPADASAPFWSQTTTLDGTAYLLTFRYNTREACYYLSIDSQDGLTTYVQGLKLVSNFFLLAGYATPPGELIAAAAGPDDSPALLGDLADGARVKLFYLEQADIIAIGGEPTRDPGPVGL